MESLCTFKILNSETFASKRENDIWKIQTWKFITLALSIYWTI